MSHTRFARRQRHKKRARLLSLAVLALLILSRSCSLLFPAQWHLPFTPHFSKSYVLLAPGDTYTLKINGLCTLPFYQSSTPLVATVTQGGNVHAWKCGKTVITATLYGKSQKKIRCLIHVTELNKKTLTLSAGQSTHIYLKGLRFVFGVKYQSSDSTIAKVSGIGKVTAIRKGSATITATCKGKEFKCRVTVK